MSKRKIKKDPKRTGHNGAMGPKRTDPNGPTERMEYGKKLRKRNNKHR